MIRQGLFFLSLVMGLSGSLMTLAPTHAQSPDSALTVGVYKSAPFVMDDQDRLTGMAIDLWEDLARDLELSYTYQDFETLRELVDAVEQGHIDLAVTNLAVTRERAERIAFTQPWFNTGHRIMINQDRGQGFFAVWKGLQDAGHVRAYGLLALIILMVTLLFTLFDRRFNPGFPARWRDGLAESFYSAISVVTSGKMAMKNNYFGWIGRIGQAFWLIVGIAVMAYLTSSITSVMTTLSVTNTINSLDDVRSAAIGVMDGSASEDYARKHGYRVRTFKHLDDAANALLSDRIAAVMGDAPVLEYYQHTHTEDALDVVGPLFVPSDYAIALPANSPLTNKLSLAILSAREQSRIEELRHKYLGNDP